MWGDRGKAGRSVCAAEVAPCADGGCWVNGGMRLLRSERLMYRFTFSPAG